jgi:hypothetical protein
MKLLSYYGFNDPTDVIVLTVFKKRCLKTLAGHRRVYDFQIVCEQTFKIV